ncbi:MAG: imidazolonepropionase [candidate division KSB1 bacterium]|nr:imidazolonepropionase [candidate division KSB1 bacterium]MDZ7272501.1 imidazolonepropionase [candidate division KSB1 bacterium]MDZ7284475.1 imidazolonepropionase [candidate division KSB1 bacterium]MDZ7297129.1 imidazolonepropionase [candidate division KSB1 bacterium]MDZ7306577.1 imidazolonepropionase [candidate division KSB1 bacterium]
MTALLIHNARLATPIAIRGGKPEWTVCEIFPAALYCENQRIARVGRQETVLEDLPACDELDAQGRLLTPGLVDCHTHPVFFNHRAHEFVLRVQGATYQQIAAAGGGIRYSVRDLRSATAEELLQRVLHRLDVFLEHGTTTIEAKSGYGLSLEHELMSLRVLQRAAAAHPVEIVPTFLGAHEVPDEYRSRRSQYVDLIIHEMIPAVAAQGLARFADVFCESHVFNQTEALQVLQAAAAHGLRPKIHADQLSESGGARVAIATGAVSADHLEHTPAALHEPLRQAGVVPVLLPGAAFFLGAKQYADARAMIAAGLPVAISTDFNPGSCMTESLPMIMTLACLALRLTPAEALVAATLHAAHALAQGNQIGSLEVGKQADAVLWEADSINEIPYHFGINLVFTVVKKGRVVFTRHAAHRTLYETHPHC